MKKVENKKEIEKTVKNVRYIDKNETVKKSQGIGGGSFIAAGIIVILIPTIFYVLLGDYNSFLQKCTSPFAMVDVGENTLISCTELRFLSVLTYLCLLFGLVLILWGLVKKLKEPKK